MRIAVKRLAGLAAVTTAVVVCVQWQSGTGKLPAVGLAGEGSGQAPRPAQLPDAALAPGRNSDAGRASLRGPSLASPAASDAGWRRRTRADELTVEQVIARDPRLQAAFDNSENPESLLEHLSAVRTFVDGARSEHACLDAYGYVVNGRGRRIAVRLELAPDPDLATRWNITGVDVTADSAAADGMPVGEDDRPAMAACIAQMVQGRQPPRRFEDRTDHGKLLIQWELTGDDVLLLPPELPPAPPTPSP